MKADKVSAVRLLKTAKGQIEGILKMIEDDRYCVDIANQILATESILHKVSRDVLRAHMLGCVQEAVENGEGKEKIDEILVLIDKISK